MERESTPLVTFFVPCLNEEGNVGRTIDTIVEVMADRRESYEIVVVDDASMDGSIAEVRDRRRRHPDLRLELVRNTAHQGLGVNYDKAAHLAKGAYFMMVCGDAAEPPETLRRILDCLGRADMVVPYFGSWDARGPLRRALSQIFMRLIKLLSGTRLRYYNGPVLHRTGNIRRWGGTTYGFGYQAELLCRLLNEGMSVIEVQIANNARCRGGSKAFTRKNFISVGGTCWRILWARLMRRIHGTISVSARDVVPAESEQKVTSLHA